jgi:hypothetical protein
MYVPKKRDPVTLLTRQLLARVTAVETIGSPVPSWAGFRWIDDVFRTPLSRELILQLNARIRLKFGIAGKLSGAIATATSTDRREAMVNKND